MKPAFEKAIQELSPIQMEAVSWNEGALLVLAGPGSGKTRVLTTRLARLLIESPDKQFKVLALTFTTKAAKEMHERVEAMLPDLATERSFIGTFHSFCTQILRTHGSHIGIRPDFGLYDKREDRVELLADAIAKARAEGGKFEPDDISWLDAIDQMKSKMVTPEKAPTHFPQSRMAAVYSLYEEALRSENALDFHGLILETCRLLAKMPSVVKRLQQTYRFMMVDEFQDTSSAQYWLLHYFAGDSYKNLFVVADDDQIIYQWAGASYRQIERFRNQFKPGLVQLVENHRCPAEVVEVANRLVSHNTQRTTDKKPIESARPPADKAIQFFKFEREEDEVESICSSIALQDKTTWGQTALIARQRLHLVPFLDALQKKGVKARILQRRDTFVSPQFVWLNAVLDQSLRPTNKRVFRTLVDSANRFCGSSLDTELLLAEATATGRSFIEQWCLAASQDGSTTAQTCAELTQRLVNSRTSWREVVKAATKFFFDGIPADAMPTDITDDREAWLSCAREIAAESGSDIDLSEFVQGLALRSKDPPTDGGTVSLLTIHGSKGLEFDVVYLVRLAEKTLPSFQSINRGDTSPEMEEERRNCFVAVTRTKRTLFLSCASVYRGYNTTVSRFMQEMQIS